MSRAAGRVKENYLLLERVSDRIKMGADVYLASHVADHCDCLEKLFEQEETPFPRHCAYKPNASETLISLASQHMSRSVRAHWRTEAIRMHVAQGMAYSQVQSDPLLSLVRHVEQEDRDRVFAALRALVPKVERIVSKDNLTRSLKSRFGPDTAVGTAVSIPELCHDRLHRCQRPADSEVGCKDDAFYSQIHSEAPRSELLSVVVMPSITEKRCIIGTIVLPIAVPLPTLGKRVVVDVEILRMYEYETAEPLRTRKCRIGRSLVDAMTLLHAFDVLLDTANDSRAHVAAALFPFVYRAERSFQDEDALLHTLLKTQPLASNRHDPALRHLSEALRRKREQLRGARGTVLVPGRERQADGAEAFEENVNYLYAVTVRSLAASRVVRGSKNGSLSDVTYFASASFEDV